jgi:hypothetical protein
MIFFPLFGIDEVASSLHLEDNLFPWTAVNFFLAFKSQFAPKCKRWHHGIGTLNGGKPQKKPKR